MSFDSKKDAMVAVLGTIVPVESIRALYSELMEEDPQKGIQYDGNSGLIPVRVVSFYDLENYDENSFRIAYKNTGDGYRAWRIKRGLFSDTTNEVFSPVSGINDKKIPSIS